MFQNFNYDYFMQKMLANVPNDLDKREGSVIWDALAPAALELETAYNMLDWILLQSFADTAERDFLIRRATERGLTPYPATYAVLKGEFTPTTVNVTGKRFNLGAVNFQAGNAIVGSPGSYQLICEEAGVVGNKQLGNLIPIDYVEDLQTAVATAILIPGEDEEDTEEFRTRYMNSFNDKRFGGNIAQYIDWVSAIDGVGGVRVTRVFNGSRTVLVTIINSQYRKASTTLVETVQEALDPDGDGKGDGIAPIGHEVTVAAADEEEIAVYLEVDFDSGYSWSNMLTPITEVISDYLAELREDWKNYSAGTATVVRVSQIETRILALTGVIDISGTKIQGVAANYNVTGNKLPVPGVITHG